MKKKHTLIIMLMLSEISDSHDQDCLIISLSILTIAIIIVARMLPYLEGTFNCVLHICEHLHTPHFFKRE